MKKLWSLSHSHRLLSLLSHAGSLAMVDVNIDARVDVELPPVLYESISMFRCMMCIRSLTLETERQIHLCQLFMASSMFPHLEWLCVSFEWAGRQQLTSADVNSLFNLPALTQLALYGCGIDAVCMARLFYGPLHLSSTADSTSAITTFRNLLLIRH
jgi:hypothetical protein